MVSILLYQPDIPQNFGGILRLCACMGITLHVVEPCGFAFDDRRLRRAAMDYAEHATLLRHASWEAFVAWRAQHAAAARLVLLTTRAATPYVEFDFRRNDLLLFGQESAGAPQEVHEAADARLRIPIRPQTRSLNVATAAAMLLGETLRQTSQFPERS